MNYNDEEYLKLFKKIKEEEQPQQNQMLRETPNYDQYQNLNEIKRQPQQPQNFNMNEFNIETRIDGKRVERLNEADPNGLNHLLENENLNEIKRHRQQQNINEVVTERQRLQQEHLENLKRQEKERETEKLNEKVSWDDDVVSLEMFNRASYNSMVQVANRINPQE